MIGVNVRNLGDHIELVRVYIVVIPPANGGCVPAGLILDVTVTLDPTGLTLPKQANVFADTGTKTNDGLVEFSCTNQSAVVFERYQIIAVVDAHGDDSAACTATPGSTFILTTGCFDALADDDLTPINNVNPTAGINRDDRFAPKIKSP